MEAEVVKEAYDNLGNDVIDEKSQSPGTSLPEPSDKGVTSLTCTAAVGRARIEFMPDEVTEFKMVTLQSRKMRQMSMFLVFFVIISLVMTGLFIWRTVFFDKLQTTDKCEDKTCSTSESKKPYPKPCRLHAKPKPLEKLPQKIVDKLNEIKEKLANYTTSSLANVVYMDKEIWSSFHGKMDPKDEHSPNLDRHSLFPVASVTKVLTSLMTFKMYKNRTIDTLDDPFVRYQPNFKIKKRFKSMRKIVIRELLSHMSGLPREAPCYPDTETNVCPYNDSVMLQRISDMYLIMKPGLKPSYSNLAFGLLGRSLPVLLYNKTYEEWMGEYLFKPLGMNDSTFNLTRNQSNFVSGQDNFKKPMKPRSWGWLNPTGGLFTSTSDLAQMWIHLFKSLEVEDYLSPVYANELFAPAYMFPGEKHITLVGLPFEMYLADGYLTRFKNGEVYGYTTNIFTVPELKLAFNVMQTGEVSLYYSTMFQELVKAFHEVLDGNTTKITLPAEPKAFIGVYKPQFQNASAPGLTQIQIRKVNEDLRMIITLYQSKLNFRLNFLQNTTFEIWDRDDTSCLMLFMRGIDSERVYFDPVSNETEYLSPGFKVYGVHPRGWTYFRRVK